MQNNTSAFFSESSNISKRLRQKLSSVLLGEERPRDMLILLSILVLLLHVWMFTAFMRPEEKITEAKPLVMEVSMVVIPAAKPAMPPAATVKPVVKPPKPLPLPPVEKKPPVKKQTKPTSVEKKPAPVVQKAPDFAPFEPFEPTPPAKQASPSTSSNTNSPSATSSATSTASSATSNFTEANYRANYAHNPKPDYPTIAKSRGWQGKVLLRVKVSAQGLSDAVTVEQSSGHELLDESAIEAVKQWRFIPAKRGETPVASSVIVPIVFTLRN